MRKTLSSWVLVFALLAGSQAFASASFANRSLGLGISAFSLQPSGADLVAWGLPITLEGGYYIEGGFDLYLRVEMMFLQQRIGFGANKDLPGLLPAIGGQFGVRYLFLEENVRPYVNLHLAGMGFPTAERIGPVAYGGIGAGGGVDFFVAESISLGVRAYVDLFLMLNAPVLIAPGGGIYATTYF
ncbi:MAG: hypothetical protein ACOZQL_16700 [Myxococcota bacterium]